MLEKLKTDHQPGRLGGRAVAVAVQLSETVVESRPVDHFAQHVQFVALVDDVFKLDSEQIALIRILRLSRGHFRLRYCKEIELHNTFLCNSESVLIHVYIY